MSTRTLRGRVAGHAPTALRGWVAKVRLRRLRRANATRPVEEVFAEIYASGRWGGETYHSGSGSRQVPAARYAAYVRNLIRSTGARTAVDIGCGDFQVAGQFVDELDGYHGVDVVREIVDRNTARYGTDAITFRVLDAATGDLPPADICLVRQVLQHLSNQQIAAILGRCAGYPLVVVTEHWPATRAQRLSNVDKPHGPDTRLDQGSWVDITAPPFGCAPVEEVLSAPVNRPEYHAGETIRTHLWRPASEPRLSIVDGG